jgi:hypothetical protein
MKISRGTAIRSGLACALGVGLQMMACTSKPADTSCLFFFDGQE